MHLLSHLKALQALDAALRHGSLARAAAELGVTSAALGQRIRALEDYVGTPLLVRGTAGVGATAMAAEVVADLGEAFAKLNQVAQALQMSHPARVVIVADPDWIELWLQPRLPQFIADNPQADITMVGSDSADHRTALADLRVAYGAIPDGAGATRLFGDYCVPLCSDDNIRRIFQFQEAPQLEGQPLLHMENPSNDPKQPDWAGWVEHFGFRQTGVERGVRYSRIAHGLQAVVADAGTLLCRMSLALPRLDEGVISMPFGPRSGAATSHCYYLGQRDAPMSRPLVGRFIHWLLGEASATQARIEALQAESDWQR